jgi:hypothetical protein
MPGKQGARPVAFEVRVETQTWKEATSIHVRLWNQDPRGTWRRTRYGVMMNLEEAKRVYRELREHIAALEKSDESQAPE